MTKKSKNDVTLLSIICMPAVFKWAFGLGVFAVGLVFFLGAGFLGAIITGIFCAIMGGLFGYDLNNHTYSKSWYPTIGMLGTFTGIVLGLYDLDISSASKIADSLPKLLGGLKLAFITSIAGLLLSMIRKLLDGIGCNKIIESDTVEKSLMGIAQNTKQLDSNAEIIEILRDLRKDFGKFASKVTDSATSQFADALGNIASDLNNKLSEQFGENFRQFGTAVTQLVQWQEQNKEYMDNYIAQLQKYTDDYNEKLQMLTDSATAVQDIVKQTSAEIAKISGQLSQLDTLGTSARDAVPMVRDLIASTTDAVNNINGMAHGFADGVKQMTADASEQIKAMVQKTIEETEQLGKKFDESVNYFMEKTITDFKNTASQINRNLGQAGGYIAGALGKLGDDLYELHNQYDDQKTRLAALENQAESATEATKTQKSK